MAAKGLVSRARLGSDFRFRLQPIASVIIVERHRCGLIRRLGPNRDVLEPFADRVLIVHAQAIACAIGRSR
jgi:hypothetical protein